VIPPKSVYRAAKNAAHLLRQDLRRVYGRFYRRSLAVVRATELEKYDLVQHMMVELGESVAVSTNPVIVATVARAQDDIARDEIIWDQITD
jgi:hypothetical protein